MTRRHQPALTGWQKHLLAELKSLAQQRPDDIQVRGRPKLDRDGEAVLRIALRTADIPHHPGGLQLQETEEFILRLCPSPYSLPAIDVDHIRFLGYPHVLAGQRLCIYLDPSREWQPTLGVAGLLSRLWDWLVDAAAGNFDASTAMYHAVGGVLHQAADTPTIVIREAGPAKRHQTACLIARSTHRYDLTYSPVAGYRTPVFTLATALPFGAASTLALLLALLDDPYKDRLKRTGTPDRTAVAGVPHCPPGERGTKSRRRRAILRPRRAAPRRRPTPPLGRTASRPDSECAPRRRPATRRGRRSRPREDQYRNPD
ncbi:hypothetical protein [Mycobacterium kiyosense]|nr:hypothetical protein IWGMT90018_16780 [Mycobacterium kiyosense]